MIFISGIIVGILLSLVSVIVGKKFERVINEPKHTIAPLIGSIFRQKATIVKTEDPVETFLNEN